MEVSIYLEAGMDADGIEALGPELDRYLSEFGDCFGRIEPRDHLLTYVCGQLSDLPRKSVEPIALAAGTPPRTLQHFLSDASWRQGMMRDRLQQIVARDHSHPLAVGVIDETSCAKKGEQTPGVKRQYCGATGKTDNCCVTVHLAYATPERFHAMLDGELFLPADWSDDRERCDAAGIPRDMVHRTKWRIALELLDRATANGVELPWLTFDEGYGCCPELLHALDDRGQSYVAEVPKTFTGWCVKPKLLHREHHPLDRTGRPRTFPRLAESARPASTVQNLSDCSSAFTRQPWQTFHVKDTAKGPSVWQARIVPFHLKRDGLPTTRPHWLVVARNVMDPDEIKYFVSNAPAGTPAEVILHVAFGRWPVERCFQDQKTELGLDHFEVRNYQSLIRHLLITAVTFLFLSKVRHDRRGEKSGPDRVPGPRRRRRDGRVEIHVRPMPPSVPGPQGRIDRLRPGPQSTGGGVPSSDYARAA
jgi:SRSO17 transposase